MALPTDVAAELEWGLAELQTRANARGQLAAYYRGEHALAFATERWRNAGFAALFERLRLNLCRSVVDAIADRLQVEGFTGQGSDAADTVWRRNRLDRSIGPVLLDALRTGDGFLLGWPDRTNRPRLWRQEPTAFTVRYAEDADEPGTLDLAVKVWRTRDRTWRANLYTPDVLHRLETRRTPQGTAETWPTVAAFDYLEADGLVQNPYRRVPVAHFANDADLGELGRSQLDDVVPLQDAVNKTLADMMIAAEFLGYPQRYALGLEPERDPVTGQERAPKPGAGQLWWSPNANAQLGQLEAGPLSPFLEAIGQLAGWIAAVSGTPPYLLGLPGQLVGQVPSGESLKVLETRHVKMVRDRQQAWGDSIEDAVILGAWSGPVPAERPDLSVAWGEAASRDQMVDAEAAYRRWEIHGDRALAMRELGYSDDEIAAAETAAALAADEAAERARVAFDRGLTALPPGTPVAGEPAA